MVLGVRGSRYIVSSRSPLRKAAWILTWIDLELFGKHTLERNQLTPPAAVARRDPLPRRARGASALPPEVDADHDDTDSDLDSVIDLRPTDPNALASVALALGALAVDTPDSYRDAIHSGEGEQWRLAMRDELAKMRNIMCGK
ncbi:hypothetical protein C362_02934 [Cryptococcus neoformans Bt1]|nr:hypothetical protein C362_02934 [Cryptococcus neoformans var. grubii Bt1]